MLHHNNAKDIDDTCLVSSLGKARTRLFQFDLICQGAKEIKPISLSLVLYTDGILPMLISFKIIVVPTLAHSRLAKSKF
jgi:hypothetical protein